MKCPKCGRVWADGVAFCPVDDAALLPGAGSSSEQNQVQPSQTAPPPAPSFTDEAPMPPANESTETSQPRMVEPLPSNDEDTWVSPKNTYVSDRPQGRSRMDVPVSPRPMGGPTYLAPPQHPSAANSNPWKVAFLAMIGVLAIGGILFWLLRSNP